MRGGPRPTVREGKGPPEALDGDPSELLLVGDGHRRQVQKGRVGGKKGIMVAPILARETQRNIVVVIAILCAIVFAIFIWPTPKFSKVPETTLRRGPVFL